VDSLDSTPLDTLALTRGVGGCVVVWQMKETGSTVLGLHLRPAPLKSNITLNPPQARFSSWHSAPFTVSSNRDFQMELLLGYEHCGSATWRIDTGNQGVSIADDGIAAQLAVHAQVR
jgi:hypothetical protein